MKTIIEAPSIIIDSPTYSESMADLAIRKLATVGAASVENRAPPPPSKKTFALENISSWSPCGGSIHKPGGLCSYIASNSIKLQHGRVSIWLRGRTRDKLSIYHH